jgi:hypothetical protein
MSIEAMKQALEALERGLFKGELIEMREQAITALRQAIEQAEHYPPECQTEAEKTAYAFGWWKALESVRSEKQEPVRLRRGNILRSIETDELCTVWATSTTGKTLIKWGANDFCEYTAEQIGELFWLVPEPDDLELAAEKSDNYAAFHAGYRFAVAHKNTGENQ